MIDQLIAALGLGLGLTSKEIADVIWLATQMQESDQTSRVDTPENVIEPEEGSAQQFQSQFDDPISKFGDPEDLDSAPQGELYNPDSQQHQSGFGEALTLRVPDARSLREPLSLARSLKPLLRKVTTGWSTVLDEAATVERIADEQIWMPVLKPALEPWLDLALVVDEGASMQIWQRTVAELQRLLSHYGVFRDVRVWGLSINERGQVQLRPGIGATARRQSPRRPSELVDPSGRRLILVATDCVSKYWQDGSLLPALKLWASSGPMAIAQLLPEWLWSRTGLGFASSVRLQSLLPGVTNQQLVAKDLSLWDEIDLESGIKVPVVTLEPEPFAAWTQMVAGKGGAWAPGFVFENATKPEEPSSPHPSTETQATPEQRVQQFRITASPMARRLAGLLAAAPVITLPVVRIIQDRLLSASRQVHVAEVFLGGLVKPLIEIAGDTNPNAVQYDFLDGVREMLLDSVATSDSVNVLNEVSQYVADRLGLSLNEFAAILRNPQQSGDQVFTNQLRPFALVTAQVLRQLGGEYVQFAEELEQPSASVKDLERHYPVELPQALDREIAEQFSPFGEADCESEVKLLKQEYSEYYFYETRFNRLALDPNVFLIVGRRGSGKTALSQFFSFQKQLRNTIAIDVDEPVAFEQMLEKVSKLTIQSREVAIPRIAKIWDFLIWLIIFRELKDQDLRIRTACIFGDNNGKVSNFIRHTLTALMNRFLDTEGDLLSELEAILADERIAAGKSAVLELAHKKTIIVAIDTLANYAINDDIMMRTTAALIQCGSEFNRDHARNGVHLKIFLMAEVFPYLKEEVILNTLKFVRHEVYLHWRPKDLMRLISWRFHHYLRAMGQLSEESANIKWDDYNEVREKMWNPYFGNSLRNDRGISELSFPYVLRHTQMHPRQLIVLCNVIAARAFREQTFPFFRPETIVKAVAEGECALAEDVLNSYSSVYPKVGRIVEALSGLPMIFKGNELDKRAPLTASEWPSGEYSPLAFRQLIAELGIVGRVRHIDQKSGFVEADFEYSSKTRLLLMVADYCVIHPMFYQRLNINLSHNLRVYSFPEHEEFQELDYR